MTMNANFPNGIIPYRFLSGAPFNDAYNEYNIASAYGTSIFFGDPVTIGTDGNLAIGVAGSAIVGIFYGCKYLNSTGTYVFSPYWPASTVIANSGSALAYVADQPNLAFSVQETNGSSAAGTPLTQVAVGQNFNFVVGSGTTASGQSTTSLNNTSTPTTATNNLKIIGLDPTIGNTFGAYANWIVIINNHLYKGSTGTSGHA